MSLSIPLAPPHLQELDAEQLQLGPQLHDEPLAPPQLHDVEAEHLQLSPQVHEGPLAPPHLQEVLAEQLQFGPQPGTHAMRIPCFNLDKIKFIEFAIVIVYVPHEAPLAPAHWHDEPAGLH